MIRTVVKLEDFSKELENWNNASLKKKRDAVTNGLLRSIPDLVEASPVDTGLYAQSWQVEMKEDRGIIGNTAPYAGEIEQGTRPFTPPIGPLLAWAKRKLSGELGSAGTGQPETDYSPEVWALAKKVQNLITERGMLPKHVMENTIPKIIENIKEEMRRSA